MSRKIIQISTCASDSGEGGLFNETLALCDDGSLWSLYSEEYNPCAYREKPKLKSPERWVRLLDIPQD